MVTIGDGSPEGAEPKGGGPEGSGVRTVGAWRLAGRRVGGAKCGGFEGWRPEGCGAQRVGALRVGLEGWGPEFRALFTLFRRKSWNCASLASRGAQTRTLGGPRPRTAAAIPRGDLQREMKERNLRWKRNVGRSGSGRSSRGKSPAKGGETHKSHHTQKTEKTHTHTHTKQKQPRTGATGARAQPADWAQPAQRA